MRPVVRVHAGDRRPSYSENSVHRSPEITHQKVKFSQGERLSLSMHEMTDSDPENLSIKKSFVFYEYVNVSELQSSSPYAGGESFRSFENLDPAVANGGGTWMYLNLPSNR